MITQDLGIATAYGYAKSKGYTGTEAEFAELMASYASTAQTAIEAADRAVEANTAAQSAKTDAAASKTAAQTAVQTATTVASEASQSASTATTKASEASQSASTASAAATSASTSAQTATAKAGTATAKADEAAASEAAALSAKTDAESARDAAAQSASEAANSAIEAAQSAQSVDAERLNRIAFGSYVVEESSGSIAHFEDGADNIPMKDVLVHIEPVQAGSGDPSPDNVRPITGWTGAHVTRCGKNLLDLSNLRKGNIEGDLNNNNVSFDEYQPIKGGQTYVWSSPSNAMSSRYLRFYDVNKTELSEKINLYGNGAKTFSAPSNARYFRAMWYVSTGVEPTDIVADQIELGSTATDYEPYSGQTYDIAFPTEAGTVYGGTLDVTKGELVVDRIERVFNGTTDTGAWYVQSINQYDIVNFQYSLSMPNAKTIPNSCINNLFKQQDTTIANTKNECLFLNGSCVLFLRTAKSRAETVNDLLAFLRGNNLQLVYELASPITYQLTPQEITSLLGENNVWADTGNSEVEYRADTKLYVDNKITQAIAAALNS